jgi:hypothetical protein
MAQQKDAMNPYTPTVGNDAAEELVQHVVEFYRSHRGQFTATQTTNICTAITAILNQTVKV